MWREIERLPAEFQVRALSNKKVIEHLSRGERRGEQMLRIIGVVERLSDQAQQRTVLTSDGFPWNFLSSGREGAHKLANILRKFTSNDDKVSVLSTFPFLSALVEHGHGQEIARWLDLFSSTQIQNILSSYRAIERLAPVMGILPMYAMINDAFPSGQRQAPYGRLAIVLPSDTRLALLQTPGVPEGLVRVGRGDDLFQIVEKERYVVDDILPPGSDLRRAFDLAMANKNARAAGRQAVDARFREDQARRERDSATVTATFVSAMG